MQITVIIQARMTSTRLPRKIMLDLCGKPVLDHLVNRLKCSKYNPGIIIATTNNYQDDIVVELAERKGIGIFRGSEKDVLERYYFAAKIFKSDIIVRVTSDCPLYEVSVLDNMLDVFLCSKGVDYFSNTIDRSFPRGLDTEIFTFSALERTYNEATTQPCREHVTPYIYQNPMKFNIASYKNNVDLSEYRWTLDTPEDFELINQIYKYLYPSNNLFVLNDILKAYVKNPQWKEINKQIKQKKTDEIFSLIEANVGHCQLVFEWVNDNEVRKNSFQTDIIPFEDHVQWFNNKLKDDNCIIYLLSDSNQFLGIVRSEKKENELIISYSVDAKHRGKGYALKMLFLLEQKLKNIYNSATLVGYVKPENLASVKIFNKLDYRVEEKNEKHIKFSKKI